MTHRSDWFLCCFVQNHGVSATTTYFNNFLWFRIYEFSVAYRTRIDVQALQAFFSVGRYPSTHNLKNHACRRFKTLQCCSAVVLYLLLLLFDSACLSSSIFTNRSSMTKNYEPSYDSQCCKSLKVTLVCFKGGVRNPAVAYIPYAVCVPRLTCVLLCLF